MSEPIPAGEHRHPIGVASGRTGLPQDLLRAWERRYQAVIPRRTASGRRFYTDEDLARLRLLKRAVDSGRRISDVARLGLAELEALVLEDARGGAPLAAPPADSRRSIGAPPATFVVRGLDAILRLDAVELRRILAEATVAMSQPALRRDVLVPMLTEIGERWRDGTFRIAHEHLATAIVRSFLDGLGERNPVRPNAPRVVIAAPTGQHHELGALLAATAALEVGWAPVYLGPDLPPAEIAAAVTATRARAVALSLVFPADDPDVHARLRELGHALPADVALLAGGGAAVSYTSTLDRLGARLVDDLSRFQAELAAVPNGPAA